MLESRRRFLFDAYFLVTKNLNPFSLDRKLADKNKYEISEHVCEILQAHLQGKNFLYLNGKIMLQPKVLEIITDFLNENENNYKKLRKNLSSYKKIFWYVYSNIFPEIYCSTEKRGFDLKSNFHIIFKTYKDKKNWKL